MGIEDLGGLGGFAGMDPSMAGFNMEELQQQMVNMCKSTLEDLRKGQQQQQAQILERQRQIMQRKKGADKLTPEQVQKWKEIEAVIMQNPEFIEPLGLSLAGLIRNKSEVKSIIDEFPDMRFAMAEFLRQEAAKRRAATSQPASSQGSASAASA